MDASSIYSCDDHLDLNAVPPDVWAARLPRRAVERAPHVVDRNGVPTWVAGDRVLGGSGRPPGTEHIKSLSAIGRAGIDDDGFRASNPKFRLEDMDRDGIWASVIYGPVPLTLSIPEPDVQDVCYAAWNDWAIDEFDAAAPDRLCLLAFLPSHSPEAAVAELERGAAKGHRGAIIDVFDIDATDRAWDRLWTAAEETGIPLSFHIKGGASPRLSYQIGKWQSAAFASLLPLQLDEALAIMIFGGALERHPGFRLVLAEAGLGWLPYYLSRMDMEWRALRDKIDYAPKDPPSEVFRRQVIATFEEEDQASQAIPLIGADHVMWASDYPHTDSTFPESQRAIHETLGSLPADDVRKITALNPRVCTGSSMSPDPERPPVPGAVVGFDHVALPMQDTEAMSAFYRDLGMEVTENEYLVQVYVGKQMINFHRPEVWLRQFSLRAQAARPPCGDLCFVWSGSPEVLRQTLDAAGAVVEEGPVERQGGRKAAASSVYTRDPDGNLLEFMSYPQEDGDAG